MSDPCHGGIRILDTALGLFAHVTPLNPSLRPETLKIKLVLEVDWQPPNPSRALSILQSQLLDLFPGLRDHRCGGPKEYHLFALAEQSSLAAPKDVTIDPALALAHTLEHLMIDTISFVSAAPRISGITAARKDSARLFDLFVECPDMIVANLATGLGLLWIAPLVRGEPPQNGGLATLELARWLYTKPGREIEVGSAAQRLGLSPAQAREALDRLEQLGFAYRRAHTMNFSGLPHYVLWEGGGSSHAAGRGEPVVAPRLTAESLAPRRTSIVPRKPVPTGLKSAGPSHRKRTR